MTKTQANHPDIGSLELTEAIIRERAYQLFENRGHEHGHDVEDWLQAEAEVMGKKSAVPERITLKAKRTAAA